jgi:hypothetical protein
MRRARIILSLLLGASNPVGALGCSGAIANDTLCTTTDECAPGTCGAGLCQPYTIGPDFASTPYPGTYPSSIAFDGSHVVFGETSNCVSFPCGVGASVSELDVRPSAATQVPRVLSTSGVVPSLGDVSLAHGLVVWSDGNYYASQSEFWTATEGEGNPSQRLVLPQSTYGVGGPFALDPRGQELYVASDGPNGGMTVYDCAIGGAPGCSPIFRDAAVHAVAMVTNGEYTLVSAEEFNSDGPTSRGYIVAITPHGNTVLNSDSTQPSSLALDATNAYWTTGGSTPITIVGTPLSKPGAPTVYARLPDGARDFQTSFATDGVYLYYAYATPTGAPGYIQSFVDYVAIGAGVPGRGTSGTIFQTTPYQSFDNTLGELAASNGFVVWADIGLAGPSHIWAVRFR